MKYVNEGWAGFIAPESALHVCDTRLTRLRRLTKLRQHPSLEDSRGKLSGKKIKLVYTAKYYIDTLFLRIYQYSVRPAYGTKSCLDRCSACTCSNQRKTSRAGVRSQHCPIPDRYTDLRFQTLTNLLKEST